MEPNEVNSPELEPEEQIEVNASAEAADAPLPEEETADMAEVMPEGLLEGEDKNEDPDAQLKAILEAVVYITDEPLTAQQIAMAIGQPLDDVERLLSQLVDDYAKPAHGVTIREVAGGYKMTTKPEHHEAIRAFVKSLKPPLKLSLAALETLAVIAYKQPITAPEVLEIRGVQGAGVIKTLLDRKLITTAGRKNVVGKPILYKTTKDFLVQFGLNDLAELPTLKEFEELKRFAMTEGQLDDVVNAVGPETPAVEAVPVEADAPEAAAVVVVAVATEEQPETPVETPTETPGEMPAEE